jgi:hypothetical protein
MRGGKTGRVLVVCGTALGKVKLLGKRDLCYSPTDGQDVALKGGLERRPYGPTLTRTDLYISLLAQRSFFFFFSSFGFLY